MIQLGNRIPSRLHRGSRKIHLLCKGGRPVYLSPEAKAYVLRDWLAANVTTVPLTLADETAFWFDLEILLPADFVGAPDTGWTSPANRLRLGVFWSNNLTSWTTAGDGWTAAPGSWPQLQPDGRNLWRARYSTPIWWQQVLIDYQANSDRYGKSITAITMAMAQINLPGYPYAMPSDAARLQSDLRTAGYPDSVVSSVSRPISVSIRNHTPDGNAVMRATMVGANVTAVTYNGVTAALSYPFAMPQQQAALQTALRNAGYSGAVVSLHGDDWAVSIPNRPGYGNSRDFSLTIDPGDPYPAWNMYKEYLGLLPDNVVAGTFSNVRAMDGIPLFEAGKAFARIGIIPTP
jgi:hypothetical protein